MAIDGIFVATQSSLKELKIKQMFCTKLYYFLFIYLYLYLIFVVVVFLYLFKSIIKGVFECIKVILAFLIQYIYNY